MEDAGYSAKDLKRPGVRAALEQLERKQADGLVVAKLDRVLFLTSEEAPTELIDDLRASIAQAGQAKNALVEGKRMNENAR